MDLADTIVAIASASGGGLRGVVRLSGMRALDIAARIVDLSASDWDSLSSGPPETIRANAELVADAPRPLPVDLFVWPSTRSYTREPTVELHTLGSPPLLDRLVGRLCEEGARLAEPGEFTLRAFYAGRIDLTQAEAVLGVIDAQGPLALQTALGQLAGGMAKPLASLREELLLLLADLEAGLDFADEQIEFISPQVLANRLAEALERIATMVRQLGSRQTNVDRPRVVLVGPTNAGKSRLFNAMVDRLGHQGRLGHRCETTRPPAALVSSEPGATRDYLTASISCDGVACVLVDTAGVESPGTEPSIASSAQRATDSMRQEAALVLVCVEAALTTQTIDHRVEETTFAQRVTDDQCLVLTKGDLPRRATTEIPAGALVTSAATGEGLDQLASRIANRLTTASPVGESESMVPSTAARSEVSLRSAEEAIGQAAQLTERGESEELVAAEVRLALHHLGHVAGTVCTDDILDQVFSRFCIGK